jgi:3-oxoacyl-(acyl-carrier-protein) synthase
MRELEFAKSRGAQIIAELVGYGLTADAHHMTAPAPGGEGAQRAMRLALEDAGVQPTEVDYVNAHGTSTPLNDLSETEAMKAVLGDHAYDIVVSSTKSMTGHTLGAAGGVESVICALALKEGKIPPTINYSQPDPDCDLNYAPNEVVERPIKLALSNSFGFGGHNACLAIKRWEE